MVQWARQGWSNGRHNDSSDLEGSESEDVLTPRSGGQEDGVLRQNGLESRRERTAKPRVLDLQPLQRSSFL